MTEEEWLTCRDPTAMLEFLRDKARNFGCDPWSGAGLPTAKVYQTQYRRDALQLRVS
jgi:hypothetical protein